MTNFWQRREYQESALEADGLARRGEVLLLSEFFTVPASSSVAFAFSTGALAVQFQFYDLSSTVHPVKAQLLENLSSFTAGAAVVPRNLNRASSDVSTVTAVAASAVVGGTVISSELVGAGHKAGGVLSSVKIHTLLPGTDYAMTFENLGGQDTLVHLNLGWAEGEPVGGELPL